MTATTKIPVTFFAPAERVPIEIIHGQSAAFRETPLASTLLNSVLNYVFVLNTQRQIVFASRNVLELVPDKKPEDILGQRPGEALNCTHANEHEGGCGTSLFCSQCGAVRAVLSSVAGKCDVQECRLTRIVSDRDESLDLLVMATPIMHQGEPYSLVSVADISHEKRRRALERIFFHDVMNLAGGVDGLLEQLEDRAPAEIRDDLQLSHAAVHQLLETVESQRDLAAAERDELRASPVPVSSLNLLNTLIRMYRRHLLAIDRAILLDPASAVVEFTTDPTLLQRVLGNLIKNALEASAPGQTVTVGCEADEMAVTFRVSNRGCLPPDAQLQVFQRSFSTKGNGRGLGTYSVKLLTERYLRGQVGFTSSLEEGTTFFVTLPRAIDVSQRESA